MIQFLIMAFEFFKTGLFAVGGGLATIPFLFDIASRYDWLDAKMLPNMIAISESTPGPIGVNMATYVGFTAGSSNGVLMGILGGIVTTFSLVLPSLIVVLIISKIFEKFKENKYVKDAFYGIRPSVTALILMAGVTVMKNAFLLEGRGLNYKALLLFVVLYAFKIVFKKLHPIVMILLAASIGVIFGF
jgi:chromate transporter